MTDSGAAQVFLPLNLFYPVRSGPGFSSEARLIFQGNQSIAAESNGKKFSQGALVTCSIPIDNANFKPDYSPPKEVPYFSLVAIFVLIVFRNRFYGAFTKYFLSIRSNYEIDFNFQRIGFLPILFCVVVVFLSTSDLFNAGDLGLNDRWHFLQEIRITTIILGLPILVSCLLFFFLDFSGKIFPLVFSDLKALFYISLLVLVWNFSSFGAQVQQVIS